MKFLLEQLSCAIVRVKFHPEIFSTIKRNRRWAERTAKKLGHPSDLCGMCAIASAKLAKDLKKLNFSSKIVVNKTETHCFLLIKNDRYILDITATQFGERFPKILTHRLNEIETLYQDKCENFWDLGDIYETTGELRQYQEDMGWPANQIVLRNHA